MTNESVRSFQQPPSSPARKSRRLLRHTRGLTSTNLCVVISLLVACGIESGAAQSGSYTLAALNGVMPGRLFSDRWSVDERDSPLIDRAGLLLERHEYSEAIPVLKQALEIQRSISGADLSAADTAFVLASVLLMIGRSGAAETLYRETLDVSHRLLGKQHPTTAIAYKGIGDVYVARQQYSEANSCYSQAIAILERASGADARALPVVLLSLGRVLLFQDQERRAERVVLRGLPLLEALGEAGRLQRAQARMLLAIISYRRGELDRSITLAMRSLPDLERLLGPDDIEVGNLLFQVGRMHTRRKEYALAEPLLERALKIAEQTFGPHGVRTDEMRLEYVRTVRKLNRKPLPVVKTE